MNIAEIARRAGVSSAAVSRYFNNGYISEKKREQIRKVVEETGWNVTGPYSADTLFISALAGDFDVVVTMYHDQGQIALKLVGFQRCITVAGGQPYPIATCAHGTAFDKVGKASVTTDSFERAVRTTARMALAKRGKASG